MYNCDIVELSEQITQNCNNDLTTDCNSACVQTIISSLLYCSDTWINIGLYDTLLSIISPCLVSINNIISSQ